MEDVLFYSRAFPAIPDPGYSGQGTAERNQFHNLESRAVRFLILDSQVSFGIPGREEEPIRLGGEVIEQTEVLLHRADGKDSQEPVWHR